MTAATKKIAERQQRNSERIRALKLRLDSDDLSEGEREALLKQIKMLDSEGLDVWEAEGGHLIAKP